MIEYGKRKKKEKRNTALKKERLQGGIKKARKVSRSKEGLKKGQKECIASCSQQLLRFLSDLCASSS